MIGVITIPAMAPSMAESAKDSSNTRLTAMPTSCAASRLWLVASIALPCKVRLKKYHRPRMAAPALPITHSDCGARVAPASIIGASPEKAGMAWISLPISHSTRPRRKIEAPMVMMIKVVTLAFLARPTAHLSSATPTIITTTTAPGAASHRGRPAPISAAVDMPPIMMNSPWAKLITWLAL